MDWLDLVTKILQSAFFLTVAIVAVLTYLQAKRTWFQPMRTEVFKQQLRAIDGLSSHFIGKSEIELRDELDFTALISINSCKLMDDYASLFFDIKFDIDKRPYNFKDCPTYMLRAEALTSDGEHYYWKEPIPTEKTPDSRTKAAIWSNYKFHSISLTRTHSDNFENLKRLSKSPLIPRQCEKLVGKYLDIAHNNVALIGEILTEASQELPEKCPNEETLKQAFNVALIGETLTEASQELPEKYPNEETLKQAVVWVVSIYNRYNHKFKLLEPLAGEIEAFIRKYLGTDNLLSSR